MGNGQRSFHEPIVLVLDENLAGEDLRADLADVAKAHDARVELLTAHVPRGTTDEVWLELAAAKRWAVITCDAHIKRRPAERAILMRAGVCVFILRNELNSHEIRDALSAAVPAICRRYRQLTPPVICHVSRRGDVTVIEGKRRGGIKR